MVQEVQPSLSQSLLLQVMEQLSALDGKIGVLQGQCNIIITEQERAAEGRRVIYAKLNKIDVIEAELGRIAPLVDAHETKSNRAAGAMSLGRAMLAFSSGAAGALITLAIKWLTDGGGRPPHP